VETGTFRMTAAQFFALPEHERFGCELLNGEVVRIADLGTPLPELPLDGCEWLLSADSNGRTASQAKIAIEIETTQYAAHVAQLTELYLQAGVESVWIVYPELKLVDVHYPGGRSRRLHEGDTLTEPEFLEGFSLSLKQLFAF
jgi:hypothetical protein